MFEISVYSPCGSHLATRKFSVAPTYKQKDALRERESKKYGGPVRLSKPTESEIVAYLERTKWN